MCIAPTFDTLQIDMTSQDELREWNELAEMLDDDMMFQGIDETTSLDVAEPIQQIVQPVVKVEQEITQQPDVIMAMASSTCKSRQIQFCSVCCGVRRHGGKFVNNHTSNGFCPVKQRKATSEDKRELRRMRQKVRRKLSKQKGVSLGVGVACAAAC
mmetsp:Transcript_8211/g.13266  ORF Transcript_8211/g.13266 Transcript_8211/m.13266 type:complete len:156 (-) Transcript_8211:185-652(-)|eukprot:CAMPEP_0203764750 /NCGR_PEP_ID=MMETSP0098-20131031/18022_1 /ASSEMBLY_ACC=CAM_ASM_000208 /TAXON_ID=96639 /ORGANISM=" , Strain NY0313808BC1" /LENGTH=155 /DNA_ID=CAMNT_0050660917 /DNA_START=36 /DNA_END=503 /DNA_ORIENTATION=-